VIAFADGGLVAGRWANFENLACLAVTGSSNDLAREVIELYFDEDQNLPMTVILAEAQPSARGRSGQWVAPAGRGLYLTFVRHVQPEEPLTLIPLAVARWVRDAIEDSTGVAARVKWPNDLYVEKRKLAGVLSESRTQGEDTYVAIGIGLNVLGRAQELPVPGATTLEEEADRPISLAAVAQGVLDRLDRELSDPEVEGRTIALGEGGGSSRRGLGHGPPRRKRDHRPVPRRDSGRVPEDLDEVGGGSRFER
jgi:biotin-[acetyl-CoA-carboxylase] ligase BirA-like protein